MAQLFLGRYEPLQFLGHGSMGQVYLARPVDLPEGRVVVKLMRDHVAREPRFRQLFQREIQSMLGLSHPYIVQLLDASFDDQENPCLVMEYIPGVDLESVLRLQPRQHYLRVGWLLGFLCHALQAAHQRGVVHRDLKPANLMITDVETEQESLRVMDFGLSKMVTKPHLTEERLTGKGVVSASGTPNYLCPDQLRGDEIDGRADIYSVGVILYEMLTGQLPHNLEDTQLLLQAHLHCKPPRFAELGIQSIPPAVEAVVLRCLEKFPNERPQSGEELAREFGRATGLELWDLTAPHPSLFREPVVNPDNLSRKTQPEVRGEIIEAWMPERMAAVKLGGFIQDLGGKILQSDPGLLRVLIGEVDTGGWMQSLGFRKVKPDPIEIEFQLSKPNPNDNKLEIELFFRTPDGYKLKNPQIWSENCRQLLQELKAYLLVRN